ncbi:MAG: exodeoxyribonuclease VII small subunit [Agathobacter sp.]
MEEKDLVNKKEEQKEPGLEERFQMIESILDQMESEDITLDASFELYKQGIAQIQAANASLDTIEKAMLVMNGNELEEF